MNPITEREKDLKEENHKIVASQKDGENHITIASHNQVENHDTIASQGNKENQKQLASHNQVENHDTIASHEDKGNHLNTAKDQPILRELGKMVAGSFYDHQLVRIQEFNRIRDIVFRRMEGIGLTEVQEKKEEKDYEQKYKDSEIPNYIEQLVKEGKMTQDEKEYIQKVFEVQKNAQKYEHEYEKLMMEFVSKEAVYTEFLSKIRGISAILSANLIKEFGYCEHAPYISSLWKYAGMHVNEGKAPKRAKGEKLEFSLKRRTMVWKIADSFMKQRSPIYRQIYDETKEEQLKRKYKKGELFEKYGKPYKKEDTHISKGHAHARALRKMVKIFLAHYWMWCKEYSQKLYENQKYLASHHNKENHQILASHDMKENQFFIAKPYVEEHMNHKHIIGWKEVIKANNKLKEE